MSLLGRKNKKGSAEAETTVDENTNASRKAKHAKNTKKNGMAQVLHESVAATVEEELSKNKSFICMVNGVPHYVCLCMNVADIGGLDKKSRKVEAKGALIEAINSGHLQAIVTPELMEAEQLVLIPDATTLFHMCDYSLLDISPETGEKIYYSLVYVNASGNRNTIDVTPIEPECLVTFEEISHHVIDEEGHIEDILGLNDEDTEDEPFFEEDENDGFDESDVDNVSYDDGMDDIPNIDDIPSYEDAMDEDDIDDDIDEEPVTPNFDQSYQPDDSTDYPTGMDNTNDLFPEEEPYSEMAQSQEQEIPVAWMQDVRTRKFYSDDLGLEVTTEPFDVQFLQNNAPAFFDENRPSGWLNDQLNEMSRQANLEMTRMHSENLFYMKEVYFNLISRHVERIMQDLSITNPRTQYGMVSERLKAARNQELSEIESVVSRKRDDLEAAWKRKLQEVGQDAARSAQRQYRERYGKQHETDIRNLADSVRSSVEGDYNDAVHEIHERRRAEATKLLDLGITEVLDEVSNQYMSLLADENARYQELEENMRVYVEDNRSHDIARANALAEELRQKDKAQAVLEEQTAKIARIRGDFEAERAKLLSDIDNLRADNKHHLDEMQSHAEMMLNHEKDHSADLQRQVQELREQTEKIYEKARAEYSHQLEEKNNEIAALHDRQSEAAYQQKRSNRVLISLVVAISLLALGAGFIFGTYIRLDHDVKDAQHYEVQYQQDTPKNAE